MSDDHEQIYGADRARRLEELLREVAQRIAELDRRGALLQGAPELLRLLGEVRSELFHYEVRITYDTPEIAEARRLVEEARRSELSFLDDDTEED